MRLLPLDFRDQYFGCEIELAGINRATAAQTLADLFGTRAEHSGGGYDAYRVKDLDGKEWKIVRDGSIHPECRRRSVLIGETYKVELNSPKLEYDEMEKLQEVVRSLRRAGGIVNDSCGMHVHALFHFYRKEVVMKLGEKIKLVRKHRGLTQRELGERLHLDGNAANRIAQYESGFRTPKEDRIQEIARVLNVRKENFFTRAETPEDIIRTLIWYDWEHDCGGSVPIDAILLFDNFEEVGCFLKEWYSQKKRLRTREIIKAKYLEWMLQWPTEKENY